MGQWTVLEERRKQARQHHLSKSLHHPARNVARIDYCNSILAGLSASTPASLHRVQNSTARLMLGLNLRSDINCAVHVPPLTRFRIIRSTLLQSCIISTSLAVLYLDDLVTSCTDEFQRRQNCVRCRPHVMSIIVQQPSFKADVHSQSVVVWRWRWNRWPPARLVDSLSSPLDEHSTLTFYKKAVLEPPRHVKHSCRKLAHNPRATQ